MTRPSDRDLPGSGGMVAQARAATTQNALSDPPMSRATSDTVEMILARAGLGQAAAAMTGSSQLAISVATGVLQRGDRILTTDGIHATVLCIDATDPKVGRWAECVTDGGQVLRFAATADLEITLLACL